MAGVPRYLWRGSHFFTGAPGKGVGNGAWGVGGLWGVVVSDFLSDGGCFVCCLTPRFAHSEGRSHGLSLALPGWSYLFDPQTTTMQQGSALPCRSALPTTHSCTHRAVCLPVAWCSLHPLAAYQWHPHPLPLLSLHHDAVPSVTFEHHNPWGCYLSVLLV
jgi:hypothetical protein